MNLLDKDKIYEVFRRFDEHCPSPQSELLWTNPYTLLVAVILSAQATDKGVNKATQTLFQKVSTPSDMILLGEEELKVAIKSINYGTTKARHIIKMSHTLIQDFNGDVPKDRVALESLAGVGRKTANVVLNVAFAQPTIAVDTHVSRVSNRLALSFGKKPIEVEADLLSSIPQCFIMRAHHHLILHGRYICKARAPMCTSCFLQDICPGNAD